MAAIGVAYTLLIVLELWRGRGDQVRRCPIMVLLQVFQHVLGALHVSPWRPDEGGFE